MVDATPEMPDAGVQAQPWQEDAAEVERHARAARGGDSAAAQWLILRFERPMRILGSRLLQYGLSEDFTQEVFFRMLVKIRGFRGDSRFSTWLFGIAYRTASEMRRTRQRQIRRELELGDHDPPDPGLDHGEDQALRALVEWGLSRIRPQHRDAMVLHYLRELSLREVGEVMGVPEATAKVYLFRGRQELFRLLEKEGGAP